MEKTPVGELIPTLANKLTVTSLKAGAYYCYLAVSSSEPGFKRSVCRSDPKAESLIRVLLF